MDVKQRLGRRLVKQPNGCREWQGYTNADGYGMIGDNERKMLRVHRLAWTLVNGPIPDGVDVLHHCDNPPCGETEPSDAYPEGHLFLGTHADNMADKATKGRTHNGNEKKTRCPQGHPYDEDNTYVQPSTGRRFCRACARDWQANRRATQRAALR
jgi:hypothetical protein